MASPPASVIYANMEGNWDPTPLSSTHVAFLEEVLTSPAAAALPEIREHYSPGGGAYFELTYNSSEKTPHWWKDPEWTLPPPVPAARPLPPPPPPSPVDYYTIESSVGAPPPPPPPPPPSMSPRKSKMKAIHALTRFFLGNRKFRRAQPVTSREGSSCSEATTLPLSPRSLEEAYDELEEAYQLRSWSFQRKTPSPSFG